MLVEDLMTIAPEHIWIEITEADRSAVQHQLDGDRYSSRESEYRGYVNALSLHVIQRWLTSEAENNPTLSPLDSLACDIPPHERASLWDVLDGVPLLIGQTRIILIPTVVPNTSGVEELCIPNEWVDHPALAADYYVAIALHETETWLQITGYATHHQIKTHAGFDQTDRTYWLDASQLIPDLTVLWVGRAVMPNPKPRVSNVTPIDQNTANQLMAQLSQQSVYSPRLDVPFSQWVSLIVNPSWRMTLHQRRVAQVETEATEATEATAISAQPATVQVSAASTSAVTHLRQWFEQSSDAVWTDLTHLSDYLRHLLEPELMGEWAGAKADTEMLPKVKPITLQNNAIYLGIYPRPTEKRSELSVTVQVTSQQDKTALPEGLTISVIDETGTPVLRKVVAGGVESLGFSPFLAEEGDRFAIELSLNDSLERIEFDV